MRPCLSFYLFAACGYHDISRHHALTWDPSTFACTCSVLHKERRAAEGAATVGSGAPEKGKGQAQDVTSRRKPVKVFASARCLSWFMGPHGECCDVILGARGQLQVGKHRRVQ